MLVLGRRYDRITAATATERSTLRVEFSSGRGLSVGPDPDENWERPRLWIHISRSGVGVGQYAAPGVRGLGALLSGLSPQEQRLSVWSRSLSLWSRSYSP